MTDTTIVIATRRIQLATLQSPIAVFKTYREKRPFGAVFANTCATQARINAKDKDLIGVFFGKGGAEKFNFKVAGSWQLWHGEMVKKTGAQG